MYALVLVTSSVYSGEKNSSDLEQFASQHSVQ